MQPPQAIRPCHRRRSLLFLLASIALCPPRCGSVAQVSTIQTIQEHGPDLTRAIFIDGPQESARLFGQMLTGTRRRPEHVILENLSPGFLLRLGPVTDRPYRVIEGTHWTRNVLRRGAPPVVDQRVERTQSLDVVPPH